jgi:prepilin-type N-terminal cleavage/methylation domain-containing protein
MEKQKGFTLVELIVVMSIISLLSSIVLVNLNGYMVKTRDAKRKEDIHQLIIAFNFAAGATGSFPYVGGTVCIGLPSATECEIGATDGTWHIMGSDSLQTQLKAAMPSPSLDPLKNRIWNAYLYTDSGVAIGCNTSVAGDYILWNPDSESASGGPADCQGVGVMACCSPGGPCNSAYGYFCAVKIN